MATEQTIRVSAKGEFGQLRSGLKNLQADLRNVTGEINRGARKGGMFDKDTYGAYTRALDLFSKRFKDSLGEINRELDLQDEALKRLHREMQSASGDARKELEKELHAREQVVAETRKQAEALERLHRMRMNEGGRFGASEGGGSGGSSGSSGGTGAGLVSGAMGLLGGVGRMLGVGLGMAGIGGIASLGSKAYELAYSRQVDTLDLAQRIRGGGGRSGSNTSMYDQAMNVGMRDQMGYTGQESWQFLDAYTRTAGNLSTGGQYDLMKFGRSYGLGASEVAGLVGNNVAGGGGNPSDFADAIAGSIAKSGMTTRISEVMETNNALLQQMNTTLKDGSAKQILAYQTTLDTIGMQNGMTQLTGSRGANIIGGLGGIFGSDASNPWKWMGIQALQRFNPEKYGNMGLFDLETSFEDGILNEDNIPAMAKYIKGASGGNEKLSKRILQKWLTDGGFVSSKREASELYDATNGLEAFSPEQMRALQNGSIDSGANYDQNREGATGQGYLDAEARFQKALLPVGDVIVTAVQTLKEGAVTVLETINDTVGANNDTGKEILKFMQDNLSLDKLPSAIGSAVRGIGEIGANGIDFVFQKMQERQARIVANMSPEDRAEYEDGIKRFQENEAKMREEYKENPWGTTASAGNAFGDFLDDKVFSPVVDFFSDIFGGGDKGDSDIGKMPRDIAELSSEGKRKFDFMGDRISLTMDSIASEHRGFKTMMYFLFEPVSKIFKEMSEQVQSAPVTPTSSMTEDAMIQSSHFPKGKNPMSGSSFFNGWQKRITSHFGDGEDRAKAHGGLDIDGNQGDALDALAGGKIQFIYKDDGSSEDADGKANTRGGGTEVGVRMPDGNTYFYSHLSAVNPNLKTGSDIEAGDWIGNMGGDRGKAGSGYSTTGSHLHLGYMDAKGGLLNPEDLLNGLSAGDSSIGSMVGGANVTVSQINVNLDVTGAGASALNSATVTQLEVLVRKIVAENERLKLQLSPTKAGYG